MEDAIVLQQLVDRLLSFVSPTVVHVEIVRQDIAKHLSGRIKPDDIMAVTGNEKDFYRLDQSIGGKEEYVLVSIGNYETGGNNAVAFLRELNVLKKSYEEVHLRAKTMLCYNRDNESLYNKIVIRLADGTDASHYYMVAVAKRRPKDE